MAERAPTSPPSSPRTAGLLLLAAGLGALAGSWWERSAPAPSSGSSLVPRPAAGIVPAGLGPVIDLSPPAGAGVAIRRDSRNLFDYTESPDERARCLETERLARIAELKSLVESIERRVRETAQIQADDLRHRQRPDPPPVALALIGKMGPPRAPMAILAAPDGEVYSARPGETVAGRYKLLALDFDTATIGYADALVAAQPVAAQPEWADRRTVLRMGAR